jgi:hypothetical protein
LLRDFYHEKLKAVGRSSLGVVVCPHEFDTQSFSTDIARASILPPPPSEPFPQTGQPIIEDVIDFLDFFRDYLQFERTVSTETTIGIKLPPGIDLQLKSKNGTKKVVKSVMERSKSLLQAASYLRSANDELSGQRKPGCRAVMATHPSHDLNSDLETLRRELERVRSRLDLYVLFVSNDPPCVSEVPKYELKMEDLVEAVYNGIKRQMPKEHIRAAIAGTSGSPAGIFEQLRRR